MRMSEGDARQRPIGMPPNLLGTLYDMEFKSFLGEGAVKFLYWLTVILASLITAVYLVGAIFTGNPILIVIAIILVPTLYILELVYARVVLEAITVVFRMSGDIRAILTASAAGAPPAGGWPAGGGGAAAPQYPQSPEYPQYPPGPDYGAGSGSGNGDSDPTATGDEDEPWIT